MLNRLPSSISPSPLTSCLNPYFVYSWKYFCSLAPPVFNPSVISQWIVTYTPSQCVVTKISETVVSSTILTVSVQLEPEIQTDCSTQTNPVKQPIRARDSLCWPIRGRVEPGNIDDDQDATMMIVSHKEGKGGLSWCFSVFSQARYVLLPALLFCPQLRYFNMMIVIKTIPRQKHSSEPNYFQS